MSASLGGWTMASESGSVMVTIRSAPCLVGDRRDVIRYLFDGAQEIRRLHHHGGGIRREGCRKPVEIDLSRGAVGDIRNIHVLVP